MTSDRSLFSGFGRELAVQVVRVSCASHDGLFANCSFGTHAKVGNAG